MVCERYASRNCCARIHNVRENICFIVSPKWPILTLYTLIFKIFIEQKLLRIWQNTWYMAKIIDCHQGSRLETVISIDDAPWKLLNSARNFSLILLIRSNQLIVGQGWFPNCFGLNCTIHCLEASRSTIFFVIKQLSGRGKHQI